MPTAVTWNGSARSVPNSGELNWSALTDFLVDLGNNAQTTNFQKVGSRVAITTPVTVLAASDCIVISNLTVAGAVAVNLPAGVTGQLFIIMDGKGDAATNNITITPAAGTIGGSATKVISRNRGAVVLAWNATQTDWGILAEFVQNIVDTSTTQTLTNKTLTSPIITDATHRGTLLLQNTAGAQPELHLSEDPDNGTNKVTMKAPAVLGGDTNFQLPNSNGTSGYVLSTDGSGNTSWASASDVTQAGNNIFTGDNSFTRPLLLELDSAAAFSVPAGRTYMVRNISHTIDGAGDVFAPGGLLGTGTMAITGTLFS